MLFPLLVAQAGPLQSPSELSLGRIPAGPSQSLRFSLTHQGDGGPIEEIRVRTGCGCLSPKVNDTSLSPHQSTDLMVMLQTLSAADGPQRWSIDVSYQHQGREYHLPLSVTATVMREVSIQPAAVVMVPGLPHRYSLTLRDRRDPPLKLDQVQSTIPGLTPTITGQPGNYRLEWQLPTDAIEQAGYLTLTTNDPRYGKLEVPLQVKRATQSAINVYPAELDIRGQSGVVQLRSGTEAAIRIDHVDCDDVLVTSTVPSAAAKILGVRVRTPKTSGESELRIHMAEPLGEVVRVPIRWR